MFCNNCIHKCNVNRKTSLGKCRCSSATYVNKIMLHKWEEPCLSNTVGAGAVFFCGCNLNCVFCQNYKLHDAKNGTLYTEEQLSDLFLQLQDNGADNIDLVTPTPHIHTIKNALKLSKKNGLRIPVVYNTSGSDTVESIHSMDGLIDIYLPDFKYVSSELSKQFSGCFNYYPNILDVLLEMYHQTGTLSIDKNGLATHGILIRHMILPCCVQDSFHVLESIHDILPSETYISLLRQYTPTEQVKSIKHLNRRITTREYDRVVQHALDLGFYNIFLQEKESAEKEYIPGFK